MKYSFKNHVYFVTKRTAL